MSASSSEAMPKARPTTPEVAHSNVSVAEEAGAGSSTIQEEPMKAAQRLGVHDLAASSHSEVTTTERLFAAGVPRLESTTRDASESEAGLAAETKGAKRTRDVVDDSTAKRLKEFEQMNSAALRHESVGKRPPKDMKRLDPGFWYEVLRVAKWGDTPALLLTKSESVAKELLEPIFNTYSGNHERELSRQNSSEAKQGEADTGTSAFYKPPKDFFMFDFQPGDKVRLTRVGYSRSRNLIAQAIGIEPTLNHSAHHSRATEPGVDLQAFARLPNLTTNSLSQTLTEQLVAQIAQIPISSLALLGLTTLLSSSASQNPLANLASNPMAMLSSQILSNILPSSSNTSLNQANMLAESLQSSQNQLNWLNNATLLGSFSNNRNMPTSQRSQDMSTQPLQLAEAIRNLQATQQNLSEVKPELQAVSSNPPKSPDPK